MDNIVHLPTFIFVLYLCPDQIGNVVAATLVVYFQGQNIEGRENAGEHDEVCFSVEDIKSQAGVCGRNQGDVSLWPLFGHMC